MSLARRLSTQAFWALAGQLATTVIGFIGFVVMVRILEMQDYGIFALAMLVVGLAEILVGQHTAGIIVQHDGLERRHENASLVVLVVFAAVSATGIFAVADAAASWFDEPALADLLRVVAILPILSALTQVPQQLLVRRLSFDTLAFGSGLAATCALGPVFGPATAMSHSASAA
ncbi:MAG: oligosaccharide flippase family protein, partial [Pseudomonadota bacterium]